MSVSVECPVCDAEIPLEREDKSGDLVQCSYCKETLRVVKKMDKWLLTEDFDE